MGKFVYIESLDSPELDCYLRLTENQLRSRLESEKAIFIAESPYVIDRALEAGCVPLSMLMGRRGAEGQGRELAERCGNIPVYTGPEELISKITGYRLTRGILCAMKRPPAESAEELCRKSRRIAVLENLVDAENVGAVFRSAAALGMDAVLLSGRCCDPLNRRALRVSMGTVFRVPWAVFEGKTAERGIELLHRQGFKCAAMALRGDTLRLDDPALCAAERLAVVLGTEWEGLQAETVNACDFTVKIPMRPGVDSLNVAAAAAVAFWQLGRRD